MPKNIEDIILEMLNELKSDVKDLRADINRVEIEIGGIKSNESIHAECLFKQFDYKNSIEFVITNQDQLDEIIDAHKKRIETKGTIQKAFFTEIGKWIAVILTAILATKIIDFVIGLLK